MKRFWTQTTVEARANGFAVLLDGKPVSVPEAGPLILRNLKLASAVAAEWQAIKDKFGPDDLPLTRLASTSALRVPTRRPRIIAELTAFGLTDLLCYRATDDALAAREAAAWDVWLAWAAREFGVALRVGTGLAHITQPENAGPAFAAALYNLNDPDLAGLGVIIPALGSLVLGIAVAKGALQPRAACDLGELDALWQESRWGADDAALARRRAIAADIAVAAQFMILCKP